MTRSRWIACAAAVALGIAAPASAARQSQEAPAGEGVICAFMIYNTIAEAGRRCTPNAEPETLAALDYAVTKLEAYILANSPDVTAAELEEFKAQVAGVGAPVEEICTESWMQMAQKLGPTELEELRTSIDGMVARPGTPTWGTCI